MNRRDLFKTFGALIGAAPVAAAMPEVKPKPGVWLSHQQAEAVNSTAKVTVFRGKRGTGKTRAGLTWLMKPERGRVAPIDDPEFRGLIMAPDTRSLFRVASLFEEMFGGTYQRDLGGIPFASGAFVRMSICHPGWPLRSDEYDRVFVDEAQFCLHLSRIPLVANRDHGRVFLAVCDENRWTEWNSDAHSYISVTLRYGMCDGYAKFVTA